MYIWLGMDVEGQFEAVKEQAKQTTLQLRYKNSCFTLPMHISLKISFELSEERLEEVVSAVSEYYASLNAFQPEVTGIENAGNIVWIRYKENAYLSEIKKTVNAILKERFGIGMHEYDYDFIFHTTLFMEDDLDKNEKAYDSVKNIPLPEKVTINRFLIGRSETGALGSYSVYREIQV